MPPLSQHYARRLLELVCDNNTFTDADHVDRDVWARSHPPLRGVHFRHRETATFCLRAGALGAVPSNPPHQSKPTTLNPHHNLTTHAPHHQPDHHSEHTALRPLFDDIDATNRNTNANQFPEYDHYHRKTSESEHTSTSFPPQSIESQPNTVSSLPSATTTLPVPPLPLFSLQRIIQSGNKRTHPETQANSMPIPPPPPPPLHQVQSYASSPDVPPPPSSPPPRIDGKDHCAIQTTPVPSRRSSYAISTEPFTMSFPISVIVASLLYRPDWINGCAHRSTPVVEHDDDLGVALGARPVTEVYCNWHGLLEA